MNNLITFAQIESAWHQHDPQLPQLIISLAQSSPNHESPIPEDLVTFDRFLDEIHSKSFKEMEPAAQFSQRIALIAQLEAQADQGRLPDHYRLHLILKLLWEDGGSYARMTLLQVIESIPLVYGAWKGLKYIFKVAEARRDLPILAALAVRIDLASKVKREPEGVLPATLSYMARRGWRFLRKLGEQASFLYPQAAVYFLAAYPEHIDLHQIKTNWILKHICFHNLKKTKTSVTKRSNLYYHAYTFATPATRKLFSAHGRAFASSWQRTPAPLFQLIQMAKSERVRQFAVDSLQHDFKDELRNVSVEMLRQLADLPINSPARDELFIWLLENSPQYEQHQFKTLGLHDSVLKMLDSSEATVLRYAIEYVRTYARDLPILRLLVLAENDNDTVRKLAFDLLLLRHPRDDVGLEGWGRLLNSRYGNKLAAKQITAHFGKQELTPAWFADRLLSDSPNSIAFAEDILPTLYSAEILGAAYFTDLALKLKDTQASALASEIILKQLAMTPLEQVPAPVWQALLLHPLFKRSLTAWFKRGSIKPATLPMWYWHLLAYQPDWDRSEWIKQQAELYPWFHSVQFDAAFAAVVRSWLADARLFAPSSLGFAWLLELAQRDEPEYHNFAVDRITKGFTPADFAPTTPTDTSPDLTDTSHQTTGQVDLTQQTFLFTGKLSGMTREVAENLVKTANGKVVSTVSSKLAYLVIGDEGSPLYDQGAKGTKQLKAEALNEAGAQIKIISETAFLKMLSGQPVHTDPDQVMAGAEVLWQMVLKQPGGPLSRLAMTYIELHHSGVAQSLTDRPVDPEAELPASFFDAERFIPLLTQGSSLLREFALKIARFELAKWGLTPQQLVTLAMSPHQDVQTLLLQAYAPLTPQNRPYHLSVETISSQIIESLCEANRPFARQLGLYLLALHPVLQAPALLYHLTENDDRQVRYEALRLLWQRYRRRTSPAQPSAKLAPQSEAGYPLGSKSSSLQDLLKRNLFELPPGRLSKHQENPTHVPQRIQSASRTKVALIETIRDLALVEPDFADAVIPLLRTFTYSTGLMERRACLVAVTQLEAQAKADRATVRM